MKLKTLNTSEVKLLPFSPKETSKISYSTPSFGKIESGLFNTHSFIFSASYPFKSEIAYKQLNTKKHTNKKLT